jgi:uncharacterized membrane protein
MKLKAAVVMVIIFLIIMFSDQVLFKGKNSKSNNTRKRPKEAKKPRKER